MKIMKPSHRLTGARSLEQQALLRLTPDVWRYQSGQIHAGEADADGKSEYAQKQS